MTWIIKATHTDKEGKQLACEKVISDDILDLALIDLRIEFFKEMLEKIEFKLMKNT
jgi:hypothetical protein